jgi:hypothetical protein
MVIRFLSSPFSFVQKNIVNQAGNFSIIVLGKEQSLCGFIKGVFLKK